MIFFVLLWLTCTSSLSLNDLDNEENENNTSKRVFINIPPDSDSQEENVDVRMHRIKANDRLPYGYEDSEFKEELHNQFETRVNNQEEDNQVIQFLQRNQYLLCALSILSPVFIAIVIIIIRLIIA